MNIGDKYYILPIQHFISYPLIDLLADIKLTRYKMICLSLFVSYAILSILGILISADTIIVNNLIAGILS